MKEILKQFAALTTGQTGVPNIEADNVLSGILYVVYFMAGAGAVMAIIVSGFVYMSGSYDPAKIVQAKNALLYSVVGLVFVIIAFAITSFIFKVM